MKKSMKMSKRYLCALLVLALVLSLIMPVAVGATDNVLLREDFSGELTGWSCLNAAVEDGRIRVGTSGGGDAYAAPTDGSAWTNYTLEFDADFGGNPYRGVSFRRQDNGDDYFWWFGDGNTNIKVVKRVSGAWTDISDVKPSEGFTGTHHFKLEVAGNAFKTYVDGNLYNTAADDSFTTGGFMLYVAYDIAYFDNVKVTEIEEESDDSALFSDDFSGDLSKWYTLNASIVDGKAKVGTSGGADAYIGTTTGNAWTDYVLEFDADFGGNPYRGVSFRRQDNGDDYFWWFGDGNTNIKVVKRVSGAWTDISDVKPSEGFTGTHHFKLEVAGNTFKTYVDGNLYNTATDDAFTTGSFLLFVAYDIAYFDNVKVTAITAEPEVPEFSDDFSGDLSKWYTLNASIADGKAKVGTTGGADAYIGAAAGSTWTDYVLEFDADFNGNPYRGVSFRRQDNGDDYFWWFGDGNTNIKVVKRVSGAWTDISDVKPAEGFTGTHHFKLEVAGNTFKTYVDGNLYNTATDDAFTTGSFLLFVAYDIAYFDNVKVTAITAEPEVPEFSDDFSSDLSKWNTLNAVISDGKAKVGTSGGADAYITAAVGSTWTDYVLEFDADFGGNPYRGVSFRRQDNGDDYFWWFGDSNTNIKVVKRVSGVWTDISDVKPSEGFTGTHHFRLEVAGNTFKTYVDGNLYNTATDDSFTAGGFQLYVAYDIVYFDNVKVGPIEQEPTEPETPDFSDDFSGDLSKWNTFNAAISDGKAQLGTAGGLDAYMGANVGSTWTNYVLEFDADFNGHPYRGISFRRQDNGDDYFWWFGDSNTNIKVVKRVSGAWTDISNVKPTVGLTGTHHFKLVVDGNTFMTFVDGTLYNTATDDAFTTGSFLLYIGNDVAWFDNVVVRAVTDADRDVPVPEPEKPEFSDDFSGDLGKWITESAQIVNGKLRLGTPGTGNNNAWATPTVGDGWTDYVLEFDADFRGQSYRGVSFRRQGNGDDYLWWFGDGASNISIVKRAAGSWKPISNTQPGTGMTGTHHFKLVVKGNTFYGLVDGTLFVTGTDDAFTSGGILLLSTYDAALFDNVVVHEVTAEDIPAAVDDSEVPNFSDNFSGNLSKWITDKASISGGRLKLGFVGAGAINAYATPTVGSNWTDYVVEFDADFNGFPYRGVSFRRQSNGDDYLWWFGDGASNIQIVKRVSGSWTPISNVQPGKNLTGTHHFKVVLKGNTFTTFMDGEIYNIARDSSMPKGGFMLLSTYDAAWFDNVKVREYRAGDENGVMANRDLWPEASVNEDFTEKPENWTGEKAQVVDGRLQLGEAHGGTLEAYYGPQGGYTWTDYVLEFDADFNGSPYRGVCFRHQQTGGDYMWWFGDDALGTIIMKRSASGWETVSDVKPSKNLQGTHHLKVVVKGNQFLTFIDDALCNTGTDNTYTAGGVQFFVNYDVAWFDNVVVRPVEDSDLQGKSPFDLDKVVIPPRKPKQQLVTETESNSNLGLIIGIAAGLVVALAAGIVVIILIKRKKKANQ